MGNVIRPELTLNTHHLPPAAAGPSLLLKGDKPQHFLLGHSSGTDWVEYDAQGWLGHAKQNPAFQKAATLLQDSQKYGHSHGTTPLGRTQPALGFGRWRLS